MTSDLVSERLIASYRTARPELQKLYMTYAMRCLWAGFVGAALALFLLAKVWF